MAKLFESTFNPGFDRGFFYLEFMYNEIMGVDNIITAGENVLAKFDIPELDDSYSGNDPAWQLVFLNLATNETREIRGTEVDDHIRFFFSTAGWLSGTYAWRMEYFAAVDSPTREFDYSDVFRNDITIPVGDEGDFIPVPGVVIPVGDIWSFTLPGTLADIEIDTDVIRSLPPGQAEAPPGLGRGRALNPDWSVGRTAGNGLLITYSQPGHFMLIIRRRGAERIVEGNIKKVILRGYSIVLAEEDRKIHEQEVITLLENIIEDRLQNRTDVIAYSLGGRSISREPLDNLRKMLSDYREAMAVRKRGGRYEKVVW